MAFKMKRKGFPMKSPVKHTNPYGTGHGSQIGVTEEEYKKAHPGPGGPDTRGYHTGHKGNYPIYAGEGLKKGAKTGVFKEVGSKPV